jgi:phosphoribosylformimino-5-aminoimidazole carboxamide ribotide isomerase
MTDAVGKEHLVLDVSCKRTADGYMVVTDRWQNMTEERTDCALLERLSEYCDEFLIHAVDVEGKADGIETELTKMLGTWTGIPITYAGGVHSLDDIRLIRELGCDRVNVTIGSALDIFGGKLKWEEVIAACR